MTVPEEFFKKDQEQIGEYIQILKRTVEKDAPEATAHEAADFLIKSGSWRNFKDNDPNGSTLSDSLQARKDELASRARGGDRFAAALQEERERTGTERGFEGEPS